MKHTQIKALAPYKWNGIWVFDDDLTGLKREAFVAGADDVIDDMVKGIPDARKGFVLLFSHEDFPGHTHILRKRRKQSRVGTTYLCVTTNKEAWLCPALFHYFDKAPQRLYAQALPR